MNGKDQCFWTKKWFLQEYLIYFKFELMINYMYVQAITWFEFAPMVIAPGTSSELMVTKRVWLGWMVWCSPFHIIMEVRNIGTFGGAVLAWWTLEAVSPPYLQPLQRATTSPPEESALVLPCAPLLTDADSSRLLIVTKNNIYLINSKDSRACKSRNELIFN